MSDGDVGIAAIWEKDPPTPPGSPRDHLEDSAVSGAAAAATANSAASASAAHGASEVDVTKQTGKVPVLAVVHVPSLMEVNSKFRCASS